MRARLLATTLSAISAIALAGCGGNMKITTPQSGQIPVSMTMRDTPPTGVTIIAFEIHVTGASLQPADSSKPAVPLVTHDTEIELRHLEVESALLSTAGAAPGTYNSLSLTFANPEMTIQNNSTAAITVGGKMCAVNAICELAPPISPMSVQVSSTPFPLTLTAGNALSLDVDFDVNASVQNDLSVNPSVSVTPTITTANHEMDEIDELAGVVGTVSTNSFTLTTFDNQMQTIQIDNNTQFENFDKAGCAADNFACVQSGQIVSVHLEIMDADEDESGDDDSMGVTSSTGLIAKKVELEDHFQKELEGEVVAVTGASSQFELVVNGEDTPLQNIALGNPVTVTVSAGATFDVDQDGLSIPSGLFFQSINDVMVGQSVEVDPSGINIGSSGISLTTDHVRLHRTHVTASIASITGANLTLTNLPSFFTAAGITQIHVQTSSQTNFDSVQDITGLSVNDTISVGGLLFNSSSGPVLLAEKLRKR